MSRVIANSSVTSNNDECLSSEQPKKPWLLANHAVHCFIDSVIVLAVPDHIYWCNGSQYERERLLDDVRQGRETNLLKSSSADVRSGESKCRVSTNALNCGHFHYDSSSAIADGNENRIDPALAYSAMHDLFAGCMRGRTLYVVPFIIAPANSPKRVIIQLTDSIEMVLAKSSESHLGNDSENLLGDSANFLHCLHSLGDFSKPDQRFICHFPNNRGVWSFGTGMLTEASKCTDCVALGLVPSWADSLSDAHLKAI